MKFEKIVYQEASIYASFNLETSKEREFFKNIGDFFWNPPGDTPPSVLKFLNPSHPPKFMSRGCDNIDILIKCKSTFANSIHDSLDSKPAIYPFLDLLLKKGIISENPRSHVEKAVLAHENH